MPAVIHVTDDRGMVFFLDQDLVLGIPEIDADHAKLLRFIDTLNRELQFKTYSTKELNKLFTKLLAYAKGHFAHEERLFTMMGYEHAVEHAAEHKKMASVLEKLSRNNAKMVDILKFLTTWLNDHLLVHDKLYVEPMKAYFASLNL